MLVSTGLLKEALSGHWTNNNHSNSWTQGQKKWVIMCDLDASHNSESPSVLFSTFRYLWGIFLPCQFTSPTSTNGKPLLSRVTVKVAGSSEFQRCSGCHRWNMPLLIYRRPSSSFPIPHRSPPRMLACRTIQSNSSTRFKERDHALWNGDSTFSLDWSNLSSCHQPITVRIRSFFY